MFDNDGMTIGPRVIGEIGRDPIGQNVQVTTAVMGNRRGFSDHMKRADRGRAGSDHIRRVRIGRQGRRGIGQTINPEQVQPRSRVANNFGAKINAIGSGLHGEGVGRRQGPLCEVGRCVDAHGVVGPKTTVTKGIVDAGAILWREPAVLDRAICITDACAKLPTVDQVAQQRQIQNALKNVTV